MQGSISYSSSKRGNMEFLLKDCGMAAHMDSMHWIANMGMVKDVADTARKYKDPKASAKLADRLGVVALIHTDKRMLSNMVSILSSDAVSERANFFTGDAAAVVAHMLCKAAYISQDLDMVIGFAIMFTTGRAVDAINKYHNRIMELDESYCDVHGGSSNDALLHMREIVAGLIGMNSNEGYLRN